MTLEEQLLKKIDEINGSVNEIFTVQKENALREAFKVFIQQQFENGNLQTMHKGLSTTEFKPEDWVEDISDDLINRLMQYFETIRGQTERNS
jgi:hypothetical protein